MRSSRFFLHCAISFALVAAASKLGAQVEPPAGVQVVDAASFERGRALAPSVIASAFGEFSGVQEANAPPGQMPTTLGNAEVTVAGTPAALLYTSPGQINFVVPASVTPGDREVVIRGGGTEIARTTVGIERISPVIFIRSGDASRPGLFLHPAGGLVEESSRAQEGEVVTVPVMGLPDSVEPANVGAMIGLTRAGATAIEPGSVPGVQFVRIRIPESLEVSGQVPFVIFADEGYSNTASIWVQ
jgi:uncharacterized protein (TIGR03437 family)